MAGTIAISGLISTAPESEIRKEGVVGCRGAQDLRRSAEGDVQSSRAIFNADGGAQHGGGRQG